MPGAFVLHERKFEHVHNMFFALLQQRLCKMDDCIVVTDGELAIVNATLHHIPQFKLVSCRNHILMDAQYWLRKRSTNTVHA